MYTIAAKQLRSRMVPRPPYGGRGTGSSGFTSAHSSSGTRSSMRFAMAPDPVRPTPKERNDILAREGSQGPPAGFSARPQGIPARPTEHDQAGTDYIWRDCCGGVMERPRRRCRRRGRAPAPGRGPAVVAATRPVPPRLRTASRARGVPAGPPAAALDPGPGGVGRRPRRPPGRPEPGRPAASTHHRVIPQESARPARVGSGWAVPNPEGPSSGGSSAARSLRGSVAVASRVGPLVLVPPAGVAGDAGRDDAAARSSQATSSDVVCLLRHACRAGLPCGAGPLRIVEPTPTHTTVEWSVRS
jgi:hypothetical protein